MKIAVDFPPYEPCCGGIRVMHYLAALLSGIGEEVATTQPCFFAPAISTDCSAPNIAIYPDVQPGNPLGAPRVIRYMLYFPSAYYKAAGGVGVPEGEMVVCYWPAYLEDCRKNYAGKDITLLELPYIEPGWCFPEPKTIENALYRGKGTCPYEPSTKMAEFPSREQHPNPFFNRMATLQFLRRVKNLYTMDHHTIVEREGVLCGCNVFRVTGKDEFAPTALRLFDCMSMVMNPMKDIFLAREFMVRAEKFFNL